MFLFFLAEHLKTSVAHVMTFSRSEIDGWSAYLAIKHRREKQALEQARTRKR